MQSEANPPVPIQVDRLTVGPFQENTFFLRRSDSTDVLVVDPGDESDRLIAFLEDSSLQPIAVINTHAHLDHIGAVQAIKSRYDVEFYLHSDDLPLLQSAPEQALLFGLAPPEVPEVNHDLKGKTRLHLAGLDLELRHTPGHSPGSVTFVLHDRVLSGDVLFRGSIGRTDLPGGSLPVLLKAIREELFPLPDETTVHSGHGPDTTVGLEKATNPFLR